MYSLVQSARIKGSAGEPIPNPSKALQKLDVDFRRGELSLVAAGPGTGKSLWALNLALYGSLPAMYWSADSNAATQLSRSTAILTGENVKDIKKALLEDKFSSYERVLGDKWWIRFSYEAMPTPADMEADLEIYYEVFGCHPHLCVVDNITNVDTGGAGDAESFTFGLEGMCEYLNDMARETEAHVQALHHVTGEWSDGLKPIPLSGVKGKIGRVPSLIMTIHREPDEVGMNRVLNLSPVKNREGFADASGQKFAAMELDSNTLRLKDVEGITF
ncbi:DnaB-like dsDNA helicase [Streptomyces phage Ibantik]|uniref:DnaB-like dsDNA helicase n=1 Tax=Streptomyces phage Ibantik TaxID=2182397 RepID=A0A2U8UPC2_9CAUD|nr:DnaB-like helicase [Streptomyces phage Ibantik]AWN05266.1 DnaB-like dsDNA helicase [Streptomyces phage Ibantik]